MLAVMAALQDEVRINVRTQPDIKRDLEITARLRGITVSSLVNLLVVREIREEKAKEPSAFVASTHGRQVASRSARPILAKSQKAAKRRTG